MIKDSGERREFSTGAVRDMGENGKKGRCDLLPLYVIGQFTGDDILALIGKFVYNHNPNDLWLAVLQFIPNFPGHNPKECLYTAFLEVAMHYEEGCQKYGERNWEKGIPLHCYIDSGVRHYLKFRRGDNDERHDRAFLWNMLCAIWTLNNLPKMNDLPMEVTPDEDH